MPAFRKSCLYIQAGALAFFPFFTFAGESIGLRLYFRHSNACAVAVAAICAACTLLSPRCEDTPSLARRVTADLLCPLAILCWVAFLLRGMTLTVLICMATCLICAMLLCNRIATGRGKLSCMILGILLSIPLSMFSGLTLIFGNFGINTVVQTLPAPQGRYYAQVIDSDQGALGGDTLVEICSEPFADLGVFYIAQKPQLVFAGDWGVWKTMEIFWLDAHTLVIDGKHYPIE